MGNRIDITAGVGDDVAQLLKTLENRDPIKRERARRALVAVGHDAVIPLLRMLKSPKHHIRWEAAKTLSEIRDPSTATALAKELDHDDHDVRWMAAEALIKLGNEGVRQTLAALLSESESVRVRESAHHVLSHFASFKSKAFLKPVLAAYRGYEPAVTIPPAALKAYHALK
jgi:HEAT repeat protein